MNTEKESVIPDPVFEAIDLHRAAWCAQMATMDLADGPLAREQGRTVTPADVETNERADRLEREAMATLKQIAPMTMAGLKAAIAYLIEWDEGEMGDDAREGLTALLGSPLFETGPQSGDAVRTGDDLDDSVMYDVERMAGIAVRVIGAILDEAQPDAKRGTGRSS